MRQLKNYRFRKETVRRLEIMADNEGVNPRKFLEDMINDCYDFTDHTEFLLRRGCKNLAKRIVRQKPRSALQSS
jgi:hypothetical protein